MDLLKPNQIFAKRYRIERLLAQGGMGAVFVAEQLATEATVAIKIMWPQLLKSEAAVKQFEIEAKIAARVNSDNIVRVIDAGYDEDTSMPFLVMELLAGMSLDQLVLKHGPVPPQDVVGYLRDVAAGLDKAHGHVGKDGVHKPIVHRDLKPENLFLTRRDSGERLVKILDFGIAKVLSQTSGLSREVKGTPLYMAYEQALAQPTTPRTDIWALGLIAFFLLSGKCYWKTAAQEEATLAALVAEVIGLPIEPPSLRAQQLGCSVTWSNGFDEWFLRCVNRDPSARFVSAGQAVSALSMALLGLSLTGVGPPTGSITGLDSPVASLGDLRQGRRTVDGVVLGQTPASNSKNTLIILTLGAICLVLVGAVSALIYFRRTPASSAVATVDPSLRPIVTTTDLAAPSADSAVVPQVDPPVVTRAPSSPSGAKAVPGNSVKPQASSRSTSPATTGTSPKPKDNVYDER